MKDSVSQTATAIYSSPGFSDHLLNSLYSMQQSEKYCDLRLHTKSGELWTHSLILLANSALFQTWIQRHNGQAELSYEIPDLTLEEVKGVMQFLYTGKLALHEDNVSSLMAFFEKLAVDKAVQLCRKFITHKSQEMAAERDNVGGSVIIKSDESVLLSEQADGKHSEGISNSVVSCTSQFDDSESEDASSTALTESLGTFSRNDSVAADNNMLFCENAVKVERVDDGFTCLKNADSFDDKVSQQSDILPDNMSMMYNTELSVLPVKRKRGRPPGCKARKNTFKLKCKGRKTKVKERKNNKSSAACKTKREIVDDAGDDITDISDIKEELPEPKKKPKKIRRRQAYARKYSCEFCEHKSIRFMELESHRHSKHDIPFDQTKYAVYKCQVGAHGLFFI